MKQQVEKLLQAPTPIPSPSKKRPLEDYEEEDAVRLQEKTPRLPNGLKGELLQKKW